MNPVITIVFSDIHHKEIGAVYYDGETLKPSNEKMAGVLDSDLKNGMTPAQWVEKFSSWSNGYVWSEKID